jgi:hypothetical protein
MIYIFIRHAVLKNPTWLGACAKIKFVQYAVRIWSEKELHASEVLKYIEYESSNNKY